MTKMPETIWAEDEHGDDHEDQGSYGSWDCRNAYGYVHEYIRADISQAAIAAAYEAAAGYAYQQWDDDDAQEHREAIRALTPDDALALLEAVKREAFNEGVRSAIAEHAKEPTDV